MLEPNLLGSRAYIIAQEKVLLLTAAHMDGSLNTPQLSIEEGVIFNGTIEMKKTGVR